MLAAELLFGAAPAGAFEAFLDESVTPRFPDGLTVVHAAGRWRAPDGRMIEERSRRVLIVTEPGAETRARLEAIRIEYKIRFVQETVGLLLTRTCADF